MTSYNYTLKFIPQNEILGTPLDGEWVERIKDSHSEVKQLTMHMNLK